MKFTREPYFDLQINPCLWVIKIDMSFDLWVVCFLFCFVFSCPSIGEHISVVWQARWTCFYGWWLSVSLLLMLPLLFACFGWILPGRGLYFQTAFIYCTLKMTIHTDFREIPSMQNVLGPMSTVADTLTAVLGPTAVEVGPITLCLQGSGKGC